MFRFCEDIHVNKSKCSISPDCSFKVSEKSSTFVVGACAVIVLSIYSIVNDYVNTVNTGLTNYSTTWLWHLVLTEHISQIIPLPGSGIWF